MYVKKMPPPKEKRHLITKLLLESGMESINTF
jgi:hypothetical protein